MNKICYHIIITLFILLFSAPAAVYAVVEDNVIIPEEHHLITISCEGTGDDLRIKKVRHEQNVTYTACRVPERVVVIYPYDKTQNVEKAKCKGVVPEYKKDWTSDLFHDDSRVCLMPLSLEAGKMKEVQFATSTSKPGFSTSMFIGDIYPVRNFSITYKMPPALKDRINVVGRHLPDSITITRGMADNGKEYQIQLTATNIPAMNIEDGAPYSRMMLPHILMTGLFKDVDELYTYLHGFTTTEDTGASEVDAMAKELTKDCTTDMERLTVIQDWVRENIRYVAIETGDLGYIPDLPSEVMKKRFGDCKGSAALIKAMLRAVGIDGRLVWIGTERIPEDFTDVPNPGVGNHMIAAAFLNDSIYYIDGTVGCAPHGFYSPSIQGQQTMIENGEHPLMHRVPVLAPETSADSVVIIGYLTDKKISGVMMENISGYFKSAFANQYRMADATQKEKRIVNYLTEGRNNFKLRQPEVYRLEPSEEYAKVTGFVEIENVCTESGGKIYFNPSLYQIKDKKINMKNRTQPVLRRFNNRLVREMHLEPTGGIKVDQLPENLHLKNRFFDATLSYSQNSNGIITCRLEIVWKERFIPFNELNAYNDDITKVSKALSQRIQISRQ